MDEYQLLAFGDARGKGVNYLAAPVFSPDSDISFEILMGRLPLDLNEAEFGRCAARLLQAADIVTNETRGRNPTVW